MSDKILIATRSFGSTSPKPWDVLEKANCELVKADMSVPMDEDRLIELLQGVDGAVVGVVPLTAHVFSHAPTLKAVSMHGVGVDHINLEAAARQGVVIANCLGTNNQAVADLAFGLMISIARNIPRIDSTLRGGEWGRYRGTELWNKTLGLVGLGYIGRAVAKRALGFDMSVLVSDPYLDPAEVHLEGVEFVDFDTVLGESDFVSLHAPLNDATRGMMGAPQFEAMKPAAYLINTARGALVDETALYSALTNGVIAGAALDVYVDEPPTGSPLLELDNVVLCAHIGAHTREAIERMGVMAAENVVRVLGGGEPHYRVV
jgi:D-3-phosphoglycerate dehydrogenase